MVGAKGCFADRGYNFLVSVTYIRRVISTCNKIGLILMRSAPLDGPYPEGAT
jgi:hypothetical protein